MVSPISPLAPKKTTQGKDSKDHFFTPYLEHTRTLRTWFVAYGVGGPLLFATQKNLIEKLIDYGCIKVVVILMLVATLIQTVSTWLYKATTYQFYLSEIDQFYYSTWIHKCSIKISKHYYWVIPLADFLTILLLLIATVMVFLAWL